MFGRLSVVSPQFAAALIFLALAAWWMWHRAAGSRRRRGRTALGVTATLLSVAAVLTLVNAYFAYLPRFRDVTSVVGEERDWPTFDSLVVTQGAAQQKYPTGVTVHLNIPDHGSGFGPTTALVYLPEQYFANPHQRFPVVYLFHGSPGVPGDWFRGGQAAEAATSLAKAGRPVIVVAPRMSHHWLDDPECVDGVKDKVESHLVRDVLPSVDESLRTVATRDGRTFGGMSAGGYCALNLGLRHRELVSTIIDMSGFTGPTHEGGPQKLFGAPSIEVQTQIDSNTPALYATNVPATPATRVWFDSGTGDTEVLHEITPLAVTLRSRGITVDFRVRAGAHTFQVWEPALREALPWSQHLPVEPAPQNPSRPGPEPSATPSHR